ncbi:hypothetical protein [Acanthamoeba polyphaga mimivirus]|uniref:Uncharacterized protein n=1 Tax=Acanthamoeba polyphaga mimivirus TaxID=212035 RepID=E3VYC5_MIMIV|nr:hypothetical protein MIMI_gp0101 [Acanthamoeba polyphaga mimivirus]ADO18427.1 hypothetical protein [Acanthamoeba polyphaga mimivirus]AHA45792.1 hypothetical protein HIRU_S886 [Hirudovirus strain Sangsue]
MVNIQNIIPKKIETPLDKHFTVIFKSLNNSVLSG